MKSGWGSVCVYWPVAIVRGGAFAGQIIGEMLLRWECKIRIILVDDFKINVLFYIRVAWESWAGGLMVVDQYGYVGRVMGDLLWGLYLVEPNGASTYNLMAIKHRARRQLLVVLLQNRHCLGFVIWLLLMRWVKPSRVLVEERKFLWSSNLW